MITKLYLNMIQSNDAPTDDILHSLRVLLKTINDGTVLFRLMQNVFTLIFLRFEHIRKTKRKRKNSENPSGSNSNQNNSHTTDVSEATAVDTLQSGFVCLKTNLKAILNSLRLFLMGMDQLEVYRSSSEELKGKFKELLKNIDNALWRLRIIDHEGLKKIKCHESVKEWIVLHGAKTANVQPEITSDEEKLTTRKKIHKKKLKKRPKIAVKSDENDEASDDPIEFQLVTETSLTENSENRTQSRSTEAQKRARSVVSKLLMNPESLVTMCMLKDDHENVQKVIEVRNIF
jgi:hypothetical protein